MWREDKKVFTTEQLQVILANIHFAPSCVDFDWKWQFEGVLGVKHSATKDQKDLHPYEPVGWLVNTTFRRPDTNTGKVSTGIGRKEFIPYGTTESGVVKTCFLLCKLIVEHEIMESFCYNGQRPFDPHNSVLDLNGIQTRKDRPRVRGRDGAEFVEQTYGQL